MHHYLVGIAGIFVFGFILFSLVCGIAELLLAMIGMLGLIFIGIVFIGYVMILE